MNRASSKQVLYVDDEPQALKYFQQLFGDQFNVAVAPSAIEAWAHVEANADAIAVVVADQRMPGNTGVELLQQLRTVHPSIVRILTTAYSDLDSAVQSVNEGGAFRYLSKPWQSSEMIGTLLRAIEFHEVTLQRDSLLNEKLSVLHRLVVMDRVRGLATAATALEGRIRNAWQALESYMLHVVLHRQMKLQINEITEMNMTAIARGEAEQMVQTVDLIRSVGVGSSTGDEANVDISSLLSDFVAQKHDEMEADDLALQWESPGKLMATTDRGLLNELVGIMLRRLADAQDQPAKITVTLQPQNDELLIRMTGDFADLAVDQHASFFAAAMPLKKWPIDLDMDLLPAFMIVHHLGGQFSIESSPPSLQAVLPVNYQARLQDTSDSKRFDTVYACLQEWENAIVDGLI